MKHEILKMLQIFIGAVSGTLSYFLGGLDGLLYALLMFVVIDYVTGIFCAINDKLLSSQIGFRGIAKKIFIIIFVGIGHILDDHIFGKAGVIRSMIIIFYLSNEGISILENAGKLGLPIPEKLRDILKQINKEEQEKSEN